MIDPKWIDIMDMVLEMLPENELTPADLQNFFVAHASPYKTQAINITNITDNEPDTDKENMDTNVKCSLSLSLIGKVKTDREQAKKHYVLSQIISITRHVIYQAVHFRVVCLHIRVL
ncbi:hypothetical protein LRAMOSA02001 [Lichtheimia ramosa]|uniref:Uncharacterized protein n=1 Tax=Lichtheimia ramosa TaxID=688394 RepID=A0A077WMV8_9FUNG|nr:hypothetical protein LRAMOSA02001 [Lichtheimia ramosa]